MPANKILIYSVMISLVIHLAVLSLTGLIEWQGKRRPARVMTLDLREMSAGVEGKSLPPAAPPPQAQPAHPQAKKVQSFAGGKIREATVDLNSSESRYRPYLKAVREKIESSWIYPEKLPPGKNRASRSSGFPSQRRRELLDTAIIRSSGFPLLDEATLRAVRKPVCTSARLFQLSRLKSLRLSNTVWSGNFPVPHIRFPKWFPSDPG
jgi:protein TonB